MASDRRRPVLALLLIATLALAGCGRSKSDDDSGKDASSQVGSAKSARDLLPADIRSAGVLHVATAVGYPPMEQYKSGTKELVGVDPDIAAAVAEKLGLKLRLSNAAFDGLIPGLQSRRWDAVMSSMSDTAERRNAVDFVDYFTAGGAVVVPKKNPAGIENLADLCGKNVVLAKGSSNLAIGQRQNKKCTTKMRITQSEDAPTGLVQLDSGRSVATIIDYPVAQRYARLSPGKYTVLSTQYDAAPWGIAIGKGNTGLRNAVLKAFQEVIDDGTYKQILTKWGVTGSAVAKAELNKGP